MFSKILSIHLSLRIQFLEQDRGPQSPCPHPLTPPPPPVFAELPYISLKVQCVQNVCWPHYSSPPPLVVLLSIFSLLIHNLLSAISAIPTSPYFHRYKHERVLESSGWEERQWSEVRVREKQIFPPIQADFSFLRTLSELWLWMLFQLVLKSVKCAKVNLWSKETSIFAIWNIS